MAAVFFTTAGSRKAAAVASLVVVFITVVINVLQMVQPDWFLMGVPGRSSGLYVNANQCGAALVIGMIIGSSLMPRRIRVFFYLFVGGGVAMTFSRSTLSGWLIASVILLISDSTRARMREIVIGCFMTVALSLVVLLSGIGSGPLDGLSLDNNQTDRVSFLKTLETSDDAALERKDVAAKAWDMFVDKPFMGHGLASTVRWAERASTHNVFLSLMADHGMLGAFILPALLICVFLGRSTSLQGSHWAFCAFTLWYALFSHNILGELYYLVGYAFFAMGGTAEGSAVASRPPSTPLSLTRPGADSFSPIVVAQ
jgi:hypothetical protein